MLGTRDLPPGPRRGPELRAGNCQKNPGGAQRAAPLLLSRLVVAFTGPSSQLERSRAVRYCAAAIGSPPPGAAEADALTVSVPLITAAV